MPLPRPQDVFAEQFFTHAGEELEVHGLAEGPYGEAYLALCALDLNDSSAIEAFVVQYGPLTFHTPVWSSEAYCSYLGFHGASAWLDCAHLLSDLVDRGGRWNYEWESEEEFIWGAWCIKDMTTAWRVARGEILESEAVWLTPCWSNSVKPIEVPELDPELKAAGFRDRSQKATPGLVLSLGMEPALQPFGPRVMSYDDLQILRPDPEDTVYIGDLPLYCVLCLELYNHMCENAPYKTCANENCGRLFVRQRGRAEHGQHRSMGVKYCSAECARAQAQRQYRRRRRDERRP